MKLHWFYNVENILFLTKNLFSVCNFYFFLINLLMRNHFPDFKTENQTLFFVILVSWTENQTEYLKMRCASFIASGKTMRKDEAQKVISEYPHLFRKRTWIDVKNKVSNFE